MDWQPYLSSAPVSSPTEIQAMEERLGVSLPDDVRRAMLEHGGHLPSSNGIDIGEGNTSFGPLLFAGPAPTKSDATYSVSFAVNELKQWVGTSDDRKLGLFPIATNTASGWFCLDYRTSPQAPKVVFVDVELEPNENGAVLPVANNLADLMSKLYD